MPASRRAHRREATGLWSLGGPRGLSDIEPRTSRLSKRGRTAMQTSVWWGVCRPGLKPRGDWVGMAGTSQGQNRTGEIPPSGNVGGLQERG